jgi:methylmalonyl-CoA/ethylmalonyl-CoA epimerase
MNKGVKPRRGPLGGRAEVVEDREPTAGIERLPMSAEYLGIDHLGIAVNNLEAATATYRDILGFKVLGSEVQEERGIEVTFLDAGNARLELLGARRPDSEVSNFLSKRGEGIHHICIKVPNIEAALEGLKARGASIVGKGVQSGAHGTRVGFVHPKGSHGVLIELVERKA